MTPIEQAIEAPYRCLKPHCPPICSGCNRAIPVTDTARMLMVKVLDSLAVDDLGNPFEEGDHMAVDEARAWLCDATPPPAPVGEPPKRLSEAEQSLQAAMASYTLTIVADSGYEATTEGRCNAKQYGAAIGALAGDTGTGEAR